MTLSVAILAGGFATRLRAVTERIPKSLVEIDGRPFAAHQIELLRRHGLTDIVFLVGHLGELVQRALGDGARWGVRLRYVFDGPTALGTGGAILAALPQLEEPFFVLYGDSYLQCDYAAIARAFQESGRPALMTVHRNDDRWDRSNVLYADGRIVKYDKRRPTPDMHYIDYGLGVLTKAAFAGHQAGETFDLAAVYEALVARDELTGFEVKERFYEIGSPAGLDETRAHLTGRGTP